MLSTLSKLKCRHAAQMYMTRNQRAAAVWFFTLDTVGHGWTRFASIYTFSSFSRAVCGRFGWGFFCLYIGIGGCIQGLTGGASSRAAGLYTKQKESISECFCFFGSNQYVWAFYKGFVCDRVLSLSLYALMVIIQVGSGQARPRRGRRQASARRPGPN